MGRDEDHLRLLSIFQYLVAGTMALFALFPVIHLALGLWMVASPGSFDHGSEPPAFAGWLFIVLGLTFILCGEALAFLIFLVGRSLSRRKRYLFCIIMAGLECLYMPLGTILGVFTIVVLTRDSVKALFHTGG